MLVNLNQERAGVGTIERANGVASFGHFPL